MTLRLYIPGDSGAVAVGADEVAAAFAAAAPKRNVEIDIVRTGSRGMYWLEPMVEAETAQGRIAYGPVDSADVGSILDALTAGDGAHALRLGPPEEIPFLT